MPVKDKLLETLQNLDFSETEARIYLAALELKEALPASIARMSGLNRTTTYMTLDRLAKRGLLNSVKKNGHLVFQVKHPQLFLEDLKRKSRLVQSSLEELDMDLPKLLTLHGSFDDKVEVAVFRGEDALRKLCDEIRRFKRVKRHRYTIQNSEVVIYGETMAIISWEGKTAVLIHNKNIAKAQKMLLENANLKKP